MGEAAARHACHVVPFQPIIRPKRAAPATGREETMQTLTSAMRRTVRLYGAQPAIVDAEGTFTWDQFADRVAPE